MQTIEEHHGVYRFLQLSARRSIALELRRTLALNALTITRLILQGPAHSVRLSHRARGAGEWSTSAESDSGRSYAADPPPRLTTASTYRPGADATARIGTYEAPKEVNEQRPLVACGSGCGCAWNEDVDGCSWQHRVDRERNPWRLSRLHALVSSRPFHHRRWILRAWRGLSWWQTRWMPVACGTCRCDAREQDRAGRTNRQPVVSKIRESRPESCGV